MSGYEGLNHCDSVRWTVHFLKTFVAERHFVHRSLCGNSLRLHFSCLETFYFPHAYFILLQGENIECLGISSFFSTFFKLQSKLAHNVFTGFVMILRINTDNCVNQHYPLDLCNGEALRF